LRYVTELYYQVFTENNRIPSVFQDFDHLQFAKILKSAHNALIINLQPFFCTDTDSEPEQLSTI